MFPSLGRATSGSLRYAPHSPPTSSNKGKSALPCPCSSTTAWWSTWSAAGPTPAAPEAWRSDTLADVYSVGKAVVALLLVQLVDESLLDLDDPVASVWPEFACAGKEDSSVRHALCHRAGVPAIRRLMTTEDPWDWETMASALATDEAWWEPGTRHAYHTNIYGHPIGELVRRVTDDLPGTRLAQLAGPLDADIWCGLTTAGQSRCAEVIWTPGDMLPAGRATT
jgi:CubicO group peptidase (beta-lactamase class C family)